jgi:hypothetical protein
MFKLKEYWTAKPPTPGDTIDTNALLVTNFNPETFPLQGG